MSYTLFTRAEYFAELSRQADTLKPGHHITVAAMSFNSRDDAIDRLMNSLAHAAQRGAGVTLIIDAHTFMASPGNLPGPLWYRPKLTDHMPEPHRMLYAALTMLKNAGGHVAITNLPPRRFASPFKSRNHMKFAIVNTTVYLGGCNLEQTARLDSMVRFDNPAAASWLQEWAANLASTGSTGQTFDGTDRILDLPGDSQIIIDAGKPGISTILQEAYRVIDTATQSLFMTCQYFPGGKTAERLLAAHKRGVRVQIYFSPPAAHGLLQPAHTAYNLRERLRLPASFFAHQMPAKAPLLHAKILASETTLMMGSHNYVTQGVQFGTAEICLELKNATMAARAKEHILKQIVSYT